jgi:hypothetical protein
MPRPRRDRLRGWPSLVTSRARVSPLVASRPEPMVAMLACKPIFGRLFVQKSGHVFDLALRAMAHELAIALGNLYGFENHMRVSHLVNMRREPIVFQCVSPVLWRRRYLPNFSGAF